MTIIQSLNRPEHPTLRNHVIKICLFGKDGSELKVLNDVAVAKAPETTLDLTTYLEADQINGIQAILLNYNDEGYVKVLLDTDSVHYFIDNLS